MTKGEVMAYLDEHAITIEVYGKPRDKQMRLAPPPWMTREAMIEHAATVGVHLKAHREAIYREFVERTTGWHDTTPKPLHPRIERSRVIAEAFRLWVDTHTFTGHRLAAMSVYTRETRPVDATSAVNLQPWMTQLYFVNAAGFNAETVNGVKRVFPSFYLPFSSPPPWWKCPGVEWRPPPDWNNTIGWKMPEETKAQAAARRLKALEERFPALYEAGKKTATEWVD